MSVTPEKREANRQRNARYREKHRDRLNESRRRYYHATGDRQRAVARDRQFRLYGIERDDYEMMLVAQRGGCKLCGSWDPGRGTPRFHVDHDHETGRVRGLLCFDCNVALGKLKDSPELMRRAATYVERYA